MGKMIKRPRRIGEREWFWQGAEKPTVGCWEWQRSKWRGYGKLKFEGRSWYAHRLAHFLSRGYVHDGLDVMHKCDNPGCIRPDHLVQGTEKDNAADMVAKGRVARGDRHNSRTRPETVPRGETNGSAKLTDEDVLWIRSLAHLAGPRQLGRAFGVDHKTICRVLNGTGWRHV